MATKTVQGLLDHCKKVVNDKVQYIYGCKLEILTQDKYNYLKRLYGSAVWDSDKSKIGKMCCDCSGLISSYTGIIRSSSNYKDTASQVATISQLKANWSNYVGWGIWLNGHIGVVSDTVGYYYALDGSARNAVHYPLDKNGWKYVIKLKDIDYSQQQTSNVQVVSNIKDNAIDVYYMTYSNGKWNKTIKNCNDTSSEGYSGVNNIPNKAITMKSSKGSMCYRVHTKGGKWLGWVNGNDVCDHKNGYAGNGRDDIDGIQIETKNVGYKVMYRVSLVNSDKWLDWVTNWNNTNDGYAGIYGKAIDKVQIKIVKI